MIKLKKAIPENCRKITKEIDDESIVVGNNVCIILPIHIDKMANLTDCVKYIEDEYYYDFDINKWNSNFA